jgi:hypothetical protein
MLMGASTMGLFVMWGVNALIRHDQVLSAAFALFALLGCGHMVRLSIKVEENDRLLAEARAVRVRKLLADHPAVDEIVAMVSE